MAPTDVGNNEGMIESLTENHFGAYGPTLVTGVDPTSRDSHKFRCCARPNCLPAGLLCGQRSNRRELGCMGSGVIQCL